MKNENIDREKLIRKTARDFFNIHALKPFQRLIIENILNGETEEERTNLLALLPTGGGKSACFMIPALLVEGLTIIVYPIIALMNDQARAMEKARLPFALLKGGMSRAQKEEILTNIEKRKIRILITNIEMLSQEWIAERLARVRVSLFVMDEAHTIITWSDFRNVYKKTPEIIEKLNPKEVLAFTATSDKSTTERLQETIFKEPPARIIYGGANRENIIYHRVKSLFPIKDIKEILSKEDHLPSIIFCTSRKRCEQIAQRLNTTFYHAELDTKRRHEIEKWFFSSNNGILVSTSAYGMGVNKPNIRSVIHLDLPNTAADYLQESGRAGRDGNLCHVYVLLQGKHLSPLEDLFEGEGCLRRKLIKSLGRKLNEECTGCDGCDKAYTETENRRRLLKFLKKRPFIYTEQTLDRKLKHVKFMRGITDEEIDKAIKQLVKEQTLKKFITRLYTKTHKTGNPFT